MERLQSIRRELAVLTQPGATPDVPPGFHGVAERLRDNDRALLLIYAQLFSDESMEAVQQLLQDRPDDALDEAFRDLLADADEATRQALAERLAPLMDTTANTSPVTLEPKTGTARAADAARSTAGHALQALYHPAQLDVLRRA